MPDYTHDRTVICRDPKWKPVVLLIISGAILAICVFVLANDHEFSSDRVWMAWFCLVFVPAFALSGLQSWVSRIQFGTDFIHIVKLGSDRKIHYNTISSIQLGNLPTFGEYARYLEISVVNEESAYIAGTHVDMEIASIELSRHTQLCVTPAVAKTKT